MLKTKSSSAGKSDSDKTEKEKYKIRNKKLKFSYNEQREYETIEDDIAKLEEKIEKLDGEIVKNATNSVKLRELMESKKRKHFLWKKWTVGSIWKIWQRKLRNNKDNI